MFSIGIFIAAARQQQHADDVTRSYMNAIYCYSVISQFNKLK